MNSGPAAAAVPVITSISAGGNYTCALTSAGGVKCWGYNPQGELGDGTTTTRLTPVDVSGLSSGVTAISAATGHTCALTSAGAAKCWGFNGHGELGDGTTTTRLTPVDVSGLSSGVTAISTGYYHTCALTLSGEIKCWGYNGDGELGDGTTTTRLTPVVAAGLAGGVSAISVGGRHTCALMSASGVKCWGYNQSGQLGDGTKANRLTPVDVSGLSSDVVQVSAGAHDTCALIAVGGVTCWGYTALSSVPQDVSGLASGVATISVGGLHACAITSAGGVKCWGFNDYGDLGNGTTVASFAPVDVSGLTSGVSLVSPGGGHTCALTTTGALKCWGYNLDGQLGDGSITDSSLPVDVVFGPTISGINNSLSAAKSIGSNGQVPVKTNWIGTDPYASIASYQAQEQISGGPWKNVKLTGPTATSLTLNLTPGKTYNFQVRATDSLGHTSPWAPGVAFTLNASQEVSASYSANWVSQSLAGSWGGTVDYTTKLNASASFTYTGRNLAWVGTKGPEYGSAKVYVDGTYWKTIDCHAGSTLKRQILLRYFTGLTNSTHTVKIVNLATAGHPRIDIDGFVSFESTT